MNKRAFTLIELLAIMTLLGIMVVLVLPQISGSIESRKTSQYNNIINTVKSAAKVYYSDNDQTSMVSVATLIQNDYLSSGLKNPINDAAINGCVLIEKDTDGYNVYTYYDDCNNITQYTMTNLVTNGSFENGDADWTLNADLTISNLKSKYGNYSVRNYHAVQWAAAWKPTNSFPVISGHIYYASTWLYSKTLGSGACHSNLDIYYDSTDHWQGLDGFQTNLNLWEKKSNRVLIPTVSSPFIILGLVGYTQTDLSQECYGDGTLLIDLTATFGAGNEPTKEWCDNNIDYFDGSKTIYAESNGTNEYTITNLAINGSFENGTTGWTVASGIDSGANSSVYGSYLLHNYHSFQYGFARQQINVIAGNKYYASIRNYTHSVGNGYCYNDMSFYYDSSDHWQGFGGNQTNIQVWEKKSQLYTIPNVTTPILAPAILVYYGTDSLQDCYADGILIVNLTAAFGAGNEPTKEWCDANLDYFEGSIVVRK